MARNSTKARLSQTGSWGGTRQIGLVRRQSESSSQERSGPDPFSELPVSELPAANDTKDPEFEAFVTPERGAVGEISMASFDDSEGGSGRG